MSTETSAPTPQPDEAHTAPETGAALVFPDEPAAPSGNGRNDPLPDLALTLFDRTQTLHELGDDSRILLDLAARLADTPIPHARKKPYKAALALVRARVDRPLSDDDQAALAAALAFHQSKLTRKELKDLDLSPAQVRRVLTIAAMLRIAAGLNSRASGLTAIQKVRLNDDELWIVIEGPEAASDAAAAQRSARLWRKLGYPRVRVILPAEAAIRLAPFPEVTETAGLAKDDPLSEAGRKLMRFQFARMLSVEEAARRGEDIEGVHDMRVGTRRLRAAFEVFEDAFRPGALKPYRNGLRQAGRALGKVRDLDVLLDNLHKYRDSLPEARRPGLDLLEQDWQARREQARLEMLDFLNGKDYSDFKRKFNLFLNSPGAGARRLPAGQPVPSTVRELAPVLIYRRLAAARAYAAILEHAPVEMLHMLRIEFKKMRYTVEYFQEVLGRRSRDVIDTLKQLQDHLGAMNDAEVACGLIEGFIHELEASQADAPPEQRASPEETAMYLAYRCNERELLIRSFPEAWQKLFWRPVFRRNVAQSVSVL